MPTGVVPVLCRADSTGLMEHGFMRHVLIAAFLFASFGVAQARPADCLLVVDQQTRIDGACEFKPSDDGFQILSSTAPLVFAFVFRSGDGSAEGHWNDPPGSTRAHSYLGTLRRDGACWANDRARVCAWKVGEPRSWSPEPTRDQSSSAAGSGYEITRREDGFPIVDVEKWCRRTYSASPSNVGACIHEEQIDYDSANYAWTGLSKAYRDRCAQMAVKFRNRFYGNFVQCVSDFAFVQSREDMSKNPPKFRY